MTANGEGAFPDKAGEHRKMTPAGPLSSGARASEIEILLTSWPIPKTSRSHQCDRRKAPGRRSRVPKAGRWDGGRLFDDPAHYKALRQRVHAGSWMLFARHRWERGEAPLRGCRTRAVRRGARALHSTFGRLLYWVCMGSRASLVSERTKRAGLSDHARAVLLLRLIGV